MREWLIRRITTSLEIDEMDKIFGEYLKLKTNEELDLLKKKIDNQKQIGAEHG